MTTNSPSSDHEHTSTNSFGDEQGLAPCPTETTLNQTTDLPLIEVFQFDEGNEAEDFFSELTTKPDEILIFKSEQQELPSQNNPCVEFINQQCWVSFMERLDGNIRDQRLSDIAERIEKNGGCMRQLQTLPSEWNILVDLFEEMFPNFAPVADLLRDYFALHNIGDHRIHFPPILLVGEAGIGKTEAARWIATHLQTPFCLIDMASAQTGSALSGSERFWTNSRVGQVFETLAYQQYANPLIMLDELDKVIGDSRFDPFAPLYALLEPSSAKTFTDLSVGDFSIDASRVNWIGTANSLSTIPQPIQTRFTVLEIEKPTPLQAKSITKNIYRRLLADANWGGFFNQELEENVANMLASYPPRTVKISLTRALGSAIRQKRDHIIYEDLILPKTTVKNGIGFLATQHSG